RLRRVHYLLAVACFCNLGHAKGESPFRNCLCAQATCGGASFSQAKTRKEDPGFDGAVGMLFSCRREVREGADSLPQVYMNAVIAGWAPSRAGPGDWPAQAGPRAWLCPCLPPCP